MEKSSDATGRGPRQEKGAKYGFLTNTVRRNPCPGLLRGVSVSCERDVFSSRDGENKEQ